MKNGVNTVNNISKRHKEISRILNTARAHYNHCFNK